MSLLDELKEHYMVEIEASFYLKILEWVFLSLNIYTNNSLIYSWEKLHMMVALSSFHNPTDLNIAETRGESLWSVGGGLAHHGFLLANVILY